MAGEGEISILDFLALVDGTDAIKYWDDSMSDWADITNATPDEDYTLSYRNGYTTLTVGQTILLGDANGDRVVSAADYACVQAAFGNIGAPGMLGDANGDGAVTAGDYASVQENFGAVAPPPLLGVPEPATLCILGLGAAMLRRKQKVKP